MLRNFKVLGADALALFAFYAIGSPALSVYGRGIRIGRLRGIAVCKLLIGGGEDIRDGDIFGAALRAIVTRRAGIAAELPMMICAC